MAEIADILKGSTAFKDLVERVQDTEIFHGIAENQAKEALKYLHKVIESERDGRNQYCWKEMYVHEYDLAIESGLLRLSRGARRNGRIVHYIRSTPYGQAVYKDLEERGYVFDEFQHQYRIDLDKLRSASD